MRQHNRRQIVESAQRSPGLAPTILASETREANSCARLWKRRSPRVITILLSTAISMSLLAGVSAAVTIRAQRSAVVQAGTTAIKPVAGWGIAPSNPTFTDSQSPDPIAIQIPSIGVDSIIDPLGLNPDGTVEVPSETAHVGWYAGNPAPGETGSSVLIGHLDSKTGPAIFYHLKDIKPGAIISITRDDDSIIEFSVQAVTKYRRSVFPTQSVYGGSKNTQLRLITCGGQFDFQTHHYLDNVVVYATLVPTGTQTIVAPLGEERSRGAL